MQLESVLELQDRLLAGFGAAAEAAAERAREGGPARRVSDVAAVEADVALGVAPAAPGDFRLAVRVQRRAALGSGRLAAVVEAARGEADVRYVGRVEKLQSPRDRHRPLGPGISVGHVDITAGTIGCFVEAGAGVAMLSNNHVLADENRAATGDPIVQPGRSDGGEPPGDVVAELQSFVPIEPEGVNRVDAAVATIATGIGVAAAELPGGGTLSDELVDPAEALGLDVVKDGRTTGRTAGRVTAFNVSNLVVQYDISDTVRFDGQIEVQPGGGDFSMGGDSGSLIVTAQDFRPVGLLFAGSDQGGDGGLPVTFANPIGEVMAPLGATLYLGS